MWNDKSKLVKTANSKWLALRYNYTLRLHRLLVCYSLLPRCWRAELSSGQEVFQFYYVVESIWLFTTDSFRTVIIMLSGQGDPPMASTKGIRWAHIESLTQQARHARGENYFSFLCCRVSRALRCKLSFRPVHQRNTLNLPYIWSWPVLVRVWTEQTPPFFFHLFTFFDVFIVYCHVDHS